MIHNKRAVLIIILSLAVGWFLGFIKIPYLDVNFSFWLGFFGTLVVIVWASILYVSSNSRIANQITEIIFNKGSEHTTLNNRLKAILVFLIFLSLLILCVYSYVRLNGTRDKIYQLETEVSFLKLQNEREEQRYKINLLLDVLHTIDSISKGAGNGPSLDLLTKRLLALSSSLKTHKMWITEHHAYQSLSSEKGLLLLALVNSELDSTAFHKILSNVSFAGADLRNADLHGLNLKSIDLKYANLENANLEGVKLDNAELQHANMIGTNLNFASLIQVNLIGAKLNWAKINEVNFQSASLDSADLSNSTLVNTNLDGVFFVQTILSNANLMKVVLSNSYMLNADMSNCNLSGAMLTKTDIGRTKLKGLILDKAIIQKDWFEMLLQKSNDGTEIILQQYKMSKDTFSLKDSSLYYLIRK